MEEVVANRWLFGFLLACLSFSAIAQNKVEQNKIVVGQFFDSSYGDKFSDLIYIKECKLFLERKDRSGLFTRVAPMKDISCKMSSNNPGAIVECSSNGQFRAGGANWVIQWGPDNPKKMAANVFDWLASSMDEADRQFDLVMGHSKKRCSGKSGEVAANSIREMINVAEGRGVSRDANPGDACDRHYVGRRILVGKTRLGGLEVYAKVLGTGGGRMTIEIQHPVTDWEVKEVNCSEY